MKVKLNEMFTEAHGKMCARDGSPILAYNRLYDTQVAYHTHKVGKDLTVIDNLSNAQKTARYKFINTVLAIKEAQKVTAQWETVKTEFKAQTKYKTIWNYAFAKFYPTASINPPEEKW